MPHKDPDERRAYQREYQRRWNRENRAKRRAIERASIARHPEARLATVERYRKRHPEKDKAQRALRRAVNAGKLLRLPCEVCGKEPSHGHHDDYSQPLNVRWLCPAHHVEAHRSVD